MALQTWDEHAETRASMKAAESADWLSRIGCMVCAAGVGIIATWQILSPIVELVTHIFGG
jgi:hypothetical protein